jgi:hypothetical protein
MQLPNTGNTSDWVVAAFIWSAAGITAVLTLAVQLLALL